MAKFCPQCGREDDELFQGLCRYCFIKETPLIVCPDDLVVNICAHCSSTLDGNRWTDSDQSEDEIIADNVYDNIELHKYAENVEISLEVLNQKGSLLEILIKSHGKMLGEDIEEECTVNVRLNRTVCPDCSKHASGYYEAVIQLRADNRPLELAEINEVDRIMKELFGKLVEKNRMAYLADRVELKEGVDYYIGSYKSARNIANNLKETLGGILKESPRLMGRDKSSGKDLYRIWISLRLPGFKIGDFILYHDLVARVVNLDGRGILVKDLESNRMHSMPWKEYPNLTKIAESIDVKSTTITNITPKTIQVLHPETYETYDLDLKEGMADLKIGRDVDIVELKGELYILI
jgi:nonsense-mediated mRNA decay protein 3